MINNLSTLIFQCNNYSYFFLAKKVRQKGSASTMLSNLRKNVQHFPAYALITLLCYCSTGFVFLMITVL